MVNELCGRRYAGSGGGKFKGAGMLGRALIARHGKVGFKLVKVKSLENGSIMRLLLLHIGLERWEMVVDDLDFECAETATCLTCMGLKTVMESLTKATFSKHRIGLCVQKVGVFMGKER